MLSKAKLFEKLGYSPHKGQALVHASSVPRRVLACGTRWGKSTCAAMEVVYTLLEPRERSLGWIVAPTADLTDRVFVPALDAIKTHFPHRIVDYFPRERRLIVVNLGGGISEIRGKSADQPVSLLGAALDWLVVDEAARLREEVWNSYLGPRLVDRGGWCLLLSTPQGANWFYRQYKRGQRNRDPLYASWASPTSDNPNIDPELIAQEKGRLIPDAFAQEYEAVFLGAALEPCDTCHGPRANASCVIDLHNDEQPLRCPECDGYVGRDGETRVTLWPSGETYTMLVVIQDGPQYKNAYRGPVRTMRSESNMRPTREIVIHGYDSEVEPVPLPGEDELGEPSAT